MSAQAKLANAPTASAFAAVPMTYALARLADATWRKGLHDGLEQRDLHLAQATSGQMAARHLRATIDGKAAVWGESEARPFRFMYVMRGRLAFAIDGQQVALNAGDTALTDAFDLARDVSWTSDFEAAEIEAPGDAMAAPVPLLAMGRRAAATAASALAGITRDRPDAYKVGDGPRRFLEYRDLGVIDATERRIHIHQVRAVDTPEGGTGWHVHSMSQLFYVFRGWVDISVEGRGTTRMVAGDAMCVAVDMRHNVSKFSADYDLIEMCLPADYSTVATPAPDGR